MWEKPDELVKSSTGNNRWKPSVKSYVEQSHEPTKYMTPAAASLLTTPYPDVGLSDLTDAAKALTVRRDTLVPERVALAPFAC
jgi:hypothetical protein